MSPSPPYYAPSDDLLRAEVSASTVAATAGQHTLRIQGYSRLKAMHGGHVKSSAFKAAGHAWRIHCYLNGARGEDAGFVYLFAKRDSADAAATDAAAGAESVVHAEIEFALLHHPGKLINWPPFIVRGDTAALRKSTTWGSSRFISAENLEASGS